MSVKAAVVQGYHLFSSFTGFTGWKEEVGRGPVLSLEPKAPCVPRGLFCVGGGLWGVGSAAPLSTPQSYRLKLLR